MADLDRVADGRLFGRVSAVGMAAADRSGSDPDEAVADEGSRLLRSRAGGQCLARLHIAHRFTRHSWSNRRTASRRRRSVALRAAGCTPTRGCVADPTEQAGEDFAPEPGAQANGVAIGVRTPK